MPLILYCNKEQGTKHRLVLDCHNISDNLHKSKCKIQKSCKFTWQQLKNDISCANFKMVRLILTTWIQLSQMECSQLSHGHGQMKVRKHFTYRIRYLNWRALVKYFGKF